MDAEVFHTRLLAWKTLEEKPGKPLTVRELEKRTGISRATWSDWLSGKGRYPSERMPSAHQWEELKILGPGWFFAFETVYRGVKEMALTNAVCPHCGEEFRRKGRQVYCQDWCRYVAWRLRRDDKRQSPAAAKLRAVL